MKRFPSILAKTSASALILSALSMAGTANVEAADLREKLIVTDAVVKLSDIFTDTGAAGEEIVMEAPAPGKRNSISSYELTKLAAEYKLDWERPAYLKRVYIHREGEPLHLDELKPVILELAREQGLEDNVNVRLYGRKNGLFLPVGLTAADVELDSFTLNDQLTRFSAIVRVPVGTGQQEELRISGTLDVVRLVPMLNKLVAPGEIISKADIDWVEISARRVNRNTIMNSQQLVGQTVTRALAANKMIRNSDIARPIAIAKGSMVQMTYKSGLLTLSMQGRALENGGIGDVIRVMNPKSKKTVFAHVEKEGSVKVTSSNHTKLAAAN